LNFLSLSFSAIYAVKLLIFSSIELNLFIRNTIKKKAVNKPKYKYKSAPLEIPRNLAEASKYDKFKTLTNPKTEPKDKNNLETTLLKGLIRQYIKIRVKIMPKVRLAVIFLK
tara:strand:+ start:114 stop:449 length:336 start_codon:yes stop_codon:yes gene_type:complete